MTLEEFKAGLEKNPALLKEVVSSFTSQVTKELEGSHIIRTKAEDADYLDNQIKTLLPVKIKEQFKTTFDGIDAKIKEVTGVEKTSADERTTDYFARVIQQMKEKGADPISTQRLKDLEAQLADVNTKLANKDNEIFAKEQDIMISAALDKANFAYPMHLKTEEEKQGYLALQRQLIASGFKQSVTAKKDEKLGIVYYDGDKALLSQKDGKPLSPSDILNEKFSHFFAPAGQQGSGTGAGQSGAAGGGASTFSTTDDVHKHLATNGLTVGSKDYMDQFVKITAENKIAV
jgi:hypothetical protein